MAPLAEAFVRVRAQTSGVRREVNREFGGAGREASREFERGFDGGGGGFFKRAAQQFAQQMSGGGGWGRSGRQAGQEFGDGFTLDAQGKLRDARGRFVNQLGGGGEFDRIGRRAGQEFGDGFTRDAQGRLRDAQGRFANEIGRMGGRVKVDADISSAISKIELIAVALLAAAPAAVPLAVGVAALVPAFTAAALGAGALAAVAVPAISRISEALKAQEQAQKTAVATGAQAASRALAQAGAQQALASAVRNAGFAHKAAVEQVRAAEQQLAQSQAAAVVAQRALTQARFDARRGLQDMKNQLIDAGLAVEQQQLSIEQDRASWQSLAAAARSAATATAAAQATLTKALAAQQAVASDPAATDQTNAQAKAQVDAARAAVKAAQDVQKAADLEARQAELNYKQSVQRLKEQQLELKRLQVDERNASRAGVEGSDQVRSARDRLAAANQQITDSERALATARAGVARADAQSAEAVANARRALTAATLQGASANAALNYAMAQLSPSARKLMGDWKGLTTEFDRWQRSMEPTVLPLFSRGINLLKGELPSLTPVVKGASGAVSGLIADVERGAKGGRWAAWKKNMTALVPTAITKLGRSTGHVISGIAGIVDAFLPSAPKVLNFVERLTKKFDKWGTGLGTSPGFQTFMQWVRDNGPAVAATVSEVATALVRLAPAAGTLGMGALGILGAAAKVINSLTPGEIQAIAIAIVAIRVATVAWSVGQWALNAALTANPIALVVVGIAALVAAVVLAYNHVGWFRAGVQAAWAGIQTASKWAWDNVLKPVFAAIGWYISNILVPGYKLLWSVVKVVWSYIQTAAQVGWNILKIVFAGIGFALKVVGIAFKTWWTIVSTVFKMVGRVIVAVWRGDIKGAFDAIKSGVGAVRNAFSTGIGAIGKAWDKMRGLTKAPVNFVIGTVYNKGIRTLWNKVMGWLHLPKSMQLGEVPMLAKGGSLNNPAKASPMMTNGPMAVVGEGRSQYPEYVIPTDPRYRGRAQALWAAAGSDMQMLAGGGVLGSILGGVKKTAGKVVGLGKGALDLITNPRAVWDRLVAQYVPSAAHLGNTTWGKAIASVPKSMLSQVWAAASQVIKAFDSGRNGDPAGVVKAAARYIGQGDDRGRDNDNMFTRHFGWPAGTPWCALFASKAIEDAKAKRRYPGAPTAAVATFNAHMKHVPTGAGRPGDLATYGSSDHINVIAKALGRGMYETIGGNEGPRVKRSRRGGQATMLRPLAAGGTLSEVFGMRNLDPRDQRAPLTRALASMAPLFDSGGMLPPGPFNRTRKPEPVMTDRQWNAMFALAERGAQGRQGPLFGDVHVHDGADVDLLMQRAGFAERAGTFG